MDRRRVCDACSVRRVKCDGQAPCAACSRSSMECTRLRQRVKSGPKGVRKKTLDRLKTVRGQRLERPQSEQSNTLESCHSETGLGDLGSTPTTINHSSYTAEGLFSPELDIDFTGISGDQPPLLDAPQISSWPFRITPVLLQPYLDIYHYKLFSVWPIVNKDLLVARLQATEPDVCAYMLASSVCAATMVQLQLSSTLICRNWTMFRSFCEGTSGRLTSESLTSFNNELMRIPISTQNHHDLQKADLSVTQQWLRLMFWKLAINKVVMTANSTDDIRSVFFPISLAKDLLSNISTMSIDTLEAHGPGMEIKLFEVTNSIADIITLNPHQSQTSTLQLGPQDLLVHLTNIIGKFRGGNKTLLPLLQSRLSSIGLGTSIQPRITDITYDSPDTNRERSSIESNEAIMADQLSHDGQSSGFFGPEAIYDGSSTSW